MVMGDIEGYPDNVWSLVTLIGLMTLPVQFMFYGMLPASLFHAVRLRSRTRVCSRLIVSA